jgi:hypothetical protein
MIKCLLTAKTIPDVLWDEARLLILPGEKTNIPSRIQQQYHLGRYYGIAYIFGMS